MNAAVQGIITISVAIVGLAVLSVIVSKNAQTPAVINSAGNAFTNAIKAATGPVSGYGSGVSLSTGTFGLGG